MDIILITIALLLLVGGILGCVRPIVPGAPLAYAGLLLLHLTNRVDFSTSHLLVWLIVVIALQVLDYITPLLGSKCSGGSDYGNRGSLAGTIIGLLFLPWGIVLGPFIGAIAGELLGGRDFPHAIKAGLGSLVGFLLGTLLKVVVCFYFLYQGIAALME